MERGWKIINYWWRTVTIIFKSWTPQAALFSRSCTMNLLWVSTKYFWGIVVLTYLKFFLHVYRRTDIHEFNVDFSEIDYSQYHRDQNFPCLPTIDFSFLLLNIERWDCIITRVYFPILEIMNSKDFVLKFLSIFCLRILRNSVTYVKTIGLFVQFRRTFLFYRDLEIARNLRQQFTTFQRGILK